MKRTKSCVIRMACWLVTIVFVLYSIVSIFALPLGIAISVFGVIEKSAVAVVAGAGIAVASKLMVAIGADAAEKFRSWIERQKQSGKW